MNNDFIGWKVSNNHIGTGSFFRNSLAKKGFIFFADKTRVDRYQGRQSFCGVEEGWEGF